VKGKAISKAVTKYWSEFYCDHRCTLCGNTGIVDTTSTAISPSGEYVGKKQFCICPNGQEMRAIAMLAEKKVR